MRNCLLFKVINKKRTENDMELQTTAKKTRIEWLDIAKGIVILTVIIGHTAEYGGTLRNFIFSFHDVWKGEDKMSNAKEKILGIADPQEMP